MLHIFAWSEGANGVGLFGDRRDSEHVIPVDDGMVMMTVVMGSDEMECDGNAM